MESLGEGTAGCWRRSDALRVCSSGVLRSQLYDGHWTSPYPGVLTDGGVVMTPVRWAAAGVLAGGGRCLDRLDPELPVSQLGAVGCARDAGRIHEIPLIDDDDPATQALDRLQ